MTACPECLRRAWLLGELAVHLEHAGRDRRALRDVLALSDADLIAALGGRRRGEVTRRHAAFSASSASAAVAAARLHATCPHDDGHPPALADDSACASALFLAGDPDRARELLGVDGPRPAVAIVGARRASPEAVECARGIGRALSAAGVTVVSGMALGIDAAAHAGALEGGGRTVAVLATGADRAYPRTKEALHRDLIARAAVISELPPGTPPYRWAFPARNRLIAALGAMTVVVEAAERSGSLITADLAAQLGREVAAVPGRAGSPRCRGSNLLLRDGALVVLDAADVLDALFGVGTPAAAAVDAHRAGDLGASPTDRPARPERGDALPVRLAAVLDAVASGARTPAALAATPGTTGLADVLAALTELELLGRVRRDLSGGYVAVAG